MLVYFKKSGMDRDEILVEIRYILQDFYVIKLQILNDRHWPVR